METINREELLELRRREELIKYNDLLRGDTTTT